MSPEILEEMEEYIWFPIYYWFDITQIQLCSYITRYIYNLYSYITFTDTSEDRYTMFIKHAKTTKCFTL